MEIYNNLERILTEMSTPYLDVNQTSKIKYAEVFTPIWLIDEQLNNCFNSEDFKNPNLKWLDPANGIGNYTIRLVQKLLIGLKDLPGLENEEVRFKWIIENMIYVAEIQTLNQFAFIHLLDLENKFKLNFYTGSFLDNEFLLHSKNNWNVDKFDRIIGNPPYKIKDNGAKASAKPIYNLFIETSIKLLSNDGVLSFITPSRWFGGGKGLDLFRKTMMSSNKLEFVKHFVDETKIFGKNVRISGGVSYFRYSKSYNGKCLFNGVSINLNNFDIIVCQTEALKLVSKIIDKQNILERFNARSYYKIQTNDVRLGDIQINHNWVPCYVSKNKGFLKFIDITTLQRQESTKWRVLTPRAHAKAASGFGNIFISAPGEYYSDTYISFFADSEEEAKSILSYLNTKFANYLLSIRKVSQDISSDTLKWIPIVPFDREWTDEIVVEWFNLTEEDIKLINLK
jgi:hypothetical protein